MPNQATSVSSPVLRAKLESNHKIAFWRLVIEIWRKHSVSAQIHELQPTVVQVRHELCQITQSVFLVKFYVRSLKPITKLHSDGWLSRYDANTLSVLKCTNNNQPQIRSGTSCAKSRNQCFLSSLTWEAFNQSQNGILTVGKREDANTLSALKFTNYNQP